MTDWKLSEHQEAEADRCMNIIEAGTLFHYPMAAYKGLLDGQEVIDRPVTFLVEGIGSKPFGVAMTEELFNAIEVEREDGSVRKGI